MKYIVFWVLAKMIAAPCPDNGTNAYGIQSSFSCLAAHFKTERDTLQKEFDNRADAVAFMEGAKPHQLATFGGGIETIWLDSVESRTTMRNVDLHPTFEGAKSYKVWREENPHIITAELRPDLFREVSFKESKPYYYSVTDSIAALRKEVAELRSVVEKMTANPFYFQGGSRLSYPIGVGLSEIQFKCEHPKTAQIGASHFCLECGEKLTIKPGKSSQNNSHGN